MLYLKTEIDRESGGKNKEESMKKSRWMLVLLLSLVFALCVGTATVAMAAPVSEDPTDFTISYAQAEEGGDFFQRLPTGGQEQENAGTDTFDSKAGTYAVSKRGELKFGNVAGMYKDFVLEMTIDPGMVSEWSQLRIWFRVYDHYSWAGNCLSFSRTADGVTSVQFMTSGQDGSINYKSISDPYNYTQEGALQLRLVSKDAQAALFIGGKKVLATDQIAIGDIGYFDIESWDAAAVLSFPIKCTVGATAEDFLEEGTEPGGETGDKIVLEEGHYLADFENFQINAVDGTAEAENTIIDFNGTSEISVDVTTSKPIFSQSSNDGEKVIYFGSDFSAAPGSAATWGDFTLTTTLRANYMSNDWSWSKLMFRGQDNRSSATQITANATQRNCYKFNFKHNTVWLTKDVEGKETTIAAANVPFLKSQFFEVKIVAEGSYIACFIDGEKIMEVNDNSFASGIFGVCTWQTAYDVRAIEITEGVSAEDKNAALVKKCADLDIAGAGANFLDDWYMTSDTGAAEILRLVTVDGVRRLRSDVSSGLTTALFGDANLQDMWMTVKFSISDAENSGWIYRLLFRSNGWATNSYYVEVTAGGLSLVRSDDDVLTPLGAYSKAIAGDTEYKVDVTAKQGTIKVYLNDVLIIDAIDSGFGNNDFGKNMMGPAGITAWNTGYEVMQLGYVAFTGDEYTGSGQSDIDVTDPTLTITTADTAYVGDSVSVTYEVSDDKTPAAEISVSIAVEKDGQSVRVIAGKFKASETGEYLITVIATDAAGNAVSAKKTITVTEKPAGTDDGSTDDGAEGGCSSAVGSGVGIAAAALLLCVSAVVICTARKKQ